MQQPVDEPLWVSRSGAVVVNLEAATTKLTAPSPPIPWWQQPETLQHINEVAMLLALYVLITSLLKSPRTA